MSQSFALSPAQQRALELSTHLVVTAAAGAGKTAVLVERMVHILSDEGVSPEQLVAITFTEEAAREMKERVVAALQERCETSRQDPRRRVHWQKQLERIDLARISTIHGFCHGLLREYPWQAGLDPEFSLWPPAEQKQCLAESVRESLRQLSCSGFTPLAELLEFLPRSQLEPLLRQMLEKRAHLSRAERIGEFRYEPLLRVYQQETALLLVELPLWRRLEAELENLEGELLRGRDQLSQRCREQKRWLARRRELPPQEFLEGIAPLLRASAPTGPWRAHPRYGVLRALWGEARAQLRRYPLLFPSSTREDQLYRRALAALGHTFRRVAATYEQAKQRQRSLDFEDLLILTDRLLRNQEVVSLLQKRFRYYLVDEFQDTNRLQWSILRALVGPDTNLFVVGDSKQSIYRFRSADVSVFQEVREWVRSRGRMVELAENYRSGADLVAFTNSLCEALFRGRLPYEPSPQRAISRRAATPPALQVHLYDRLQGYRSEAELTAAWIRQLLDGEGFRPSQIAVLLRTRTSMSDYEEMLARHGIPFLSMAGSSLFGRQEILDLVNLLRVLENPHDDAALLGVLRSPFFNVSDEKLYHLAAAGGGSLWSRLERRAQGASRRREFCEEIVGCLLRWRGRSAQSSLAGLLQGALEERGYLEILQESRRHPTAVASVREFLEFLREWESAGSPSIREFLALFEVIRGEDSERSTAFHSWGGEAVRLLTVHGAKGLQFPVVILPELGRPLSRLRRDLFYLQEVQWGNGRETYLGLNLWNPEEEFRPLRHPVYEMLKRLDEYRMWAEEKRLLYVAVTRACDRLILIGRRGEERSYAAWLSEAGAERYQTSPPPLPVPGTAPAERPQADLPEREASPPLRPLPPAKRTWTPTEIVQWLRCPYQFYLQRVLYAEVPEFRFDQKSRSRQFLGLAVHGLLENWERLTEPAFLGEALRQLDQAHWNLLAPRERKELREKVLRHIEQVLQHPVWKELERAKQVYSEHPFGLEVNERKIKGTVDKLIHRESGSWLVVDFKTGPRPDSPATRQEHQWQVEIYLWVLSQLLGTMDIQGCLLYTECGEEVPVPFGEGVRKRWQGVIRKLPLPLQEPLFPKTSHSSHCLSCAFSRADLCAPPVVSQMSLW